MSKQWQIRRGTTLENDAFTGAIGEITMDTTTKGLRVHDGSTQGGIEIPTAMTSDYVVESQLPTAENNYTWYRKYKSGWVEQGGQIPAQAGGSFNVTLPVEMADTNYHFLGGGSKNSTDNGFIDVNIYNTGITTTGFTAMIRFAYNGSTGNPDERGWWEVKGIAA